MIQFLEDKVIGKDGNLAVWAKPETGHQYVIGGDVAEGLEHGDYSAAHVIDATTGTQVAVWHGHTPADVFGDELEILGLWYNSALVGVEQNNHGLTTITKLRQLNYPHIYRHRTIDQVSKKVTLKFGWPTNKATKPKMIDDLDEALRKGELTLHHKRTIAELKTFVRDEHARMHGSPFDDLVMSLAIAYQMVPYVFQVDEVNPTDDRWTGDWWARQAGIVNTSTGAHAEGATDQPIGFHNQRAR